MSALPDYYGVLEISPDADENEIRMAFHAQMKKYHPDLYKGDHAVSERKSREINEANSVLGNANKRALYDLDRNKVGETSQKLNQAPTANNAPHSAGTGPTPTQTSQPTNAPIHKVQYVRDRKSLKPWLMALGFLTLLHACQDESTNPKAARNQNYTPPKTVVGMQKQGTHIPMSPTASPIPITPIQTSPQFNPQPMNGIYKWDAKRDGQPKNYTIDDYGLTLNSRPEKNGAFIPVLDVMKFGMPKLEIVGEPRDGGASASFAVTKLDPGSDGKQIIFFSYSGGVHCCTTVIVVGKYGIEWKKLELGSWDGDVFTELPKDVDGDGIPDLIFRDGAFNYRFSSYADSFPPPKIFNIINGEAIDVSDSPKYERFYRKEIEPAKNACLQHNNGGCAGYLAMAARIDEYPTAWATMIQNFDKTSDWGLEPLCLTKKVDGLCPPGMSSTKPQFPLVLENFLREKHYIHDVLSTTSIWETPLASPSGGVAFDGAAQSEHSAIDIKPSFDCSKVHSDVLLLICSKPELAAADQELAKAYTAALAGNLNSDSVRQSELVWIKERNSSEPNLSVLLKLYYDRIEELHNLRQ